MPSIRYYLNGADAYRLKLLLPLSPEQEALLKLKKEKEAAALAAGTLDDISTSRLVM